MGILKLMDFLKSKIPRSIQDVVPTNLKGKRIAIDASNVIYQFLIQTQVINSNDNLSMPTDMYGNKTGHLLGLMARVSFCLENNIQAVWVFDGKPPAEKYKQLSRRSKVKQEAGQKMEEALIDGDLMEALKHQKRTMKITQTEKEHAIKMLNLMGLPTIEAPAQSEAQCAYLSKIGAVDFVVTEDMDCLPLGSKAMLKTFSKNKTIKQINLQRILQDSGLSLDQFIDLCILCGCDYTGRISNIGPVRAYDLIKKHKSIENIVEHVKITETGRYRIDTEFDYGSARRLFKQPTILKVEEDLKWSKPDKDNLTTFLRDLDFNEVRINNWLNKASKLAADG